MVLHYVFIILQTWRKSTITAYNIFVYLWLTRYLFNLLRINMFFLINMTTNFVNVEFNRSVVTIFRKSDIIATWW